MLIHNYKQQANLVNASNSLPYINSRSHHFLLKKYNFSSLSINFTYLLQFTSKLALNYFPSVLAP